MKVPIGQIIPIHKLTNQKLLTERAASILYDYYQNTFKSAISRCAESETGTTYVPPFEYPVFTSEPVEWYINLVNQLKVPCSLEIDSPVTKMHWLSLTVFEYLNSMYGKAGLQETICEAVGLGLLDNLSCKSINLWLSSDEYISEKDAIQIIENLEFYITSF